jgi:hypothetical protein
MNPPISAFQNIKIGHGYAVGPPASERDYLRTDLLSAGDTANTRQGFVLSLDEFQQHNALVLIAIWQLCR